MGTLVLASRRRRPIHGTASVAAPSLTLVAYAWMHGIAVAFAAQRRGMVSRMRRGKEEDFRAHTPRK